MQITVLIAFAATLLLHEVGPLYAPGWPLVLAGVAYVVGAAALGRLGSAIVLRRLGQCDDVPPHVERLRGRLNAIVSAWLVGGSLVLVELGWGACLGQVGLMNWPLVGKVALLSPFGLALILSWLAEYPAYVAIRLRAARGLAYGGPSSAAAAWTLREYLSYNIRHQLLFIAVPVGLILLAGDVLQLYVAPLLPRGWGDYVIAAATLLASGAVFVAAPALIVRVWKTAVMPAPGLREHLEAICRRMGLRFREILIWRTGGLITNAGVMGLIAPIRYVLLSDALLDNMNRLQVEAVFAHEAGHITSHHIFYSVLFAAGSMAWAMVGGSFVASTMNWPDAASEVVALAILMVMWAGVFGWLSRRFERQSDVIAAWVMGWLHGDAAAGPLAAHSPRAGATASADSQGGRILPEGAALFADALGRVAVLNGVSPGRWNWRHGSIAWRVHYILSLGSTGGSRAQIDRTIGRIKIALWISLLLAVAIMAMQFWHEAHIIHD